MHRKAAARSQPGRPSPAAAVRQAASRARGAPEDVPEELPGDLPDPAGTRAAPEPPGPATNGVEPPRFPPLSTSLPAFIDDGCDRSFRQTIYGLLQASALMLKAREHYAAAIGLTGPQYSMLVAIAEAGETTVTDLAATLHVSSPFVTSEVNKLVRGGAVAKRPNASDGRSSLLSLTPEGRDRVHRVADIRRLGNDLIFGSFNRREARSLSHLVGVLVRDLERAVHELDAPRWRDEDDDR